MDRALSRIVFPLVLVATILAFTLALAPSVSASAHTKPRGTPGSIVQVAGAPRLSASAETATPTAPAQGESKPGSTSGIVVMSFAIALIILFPILLQRSLWTR